MGWAKVKRKRLDAKILELNHDALATLRDALRARSITHALDELLSVGPVALFEMVNANRQDAVNLNSQDAVKMPSTRTDKMPSSGRQLAQDAVNLNGGSSMPTGARSKLIDNSLEIDHADRNGEAERTRTKNKTEIKAETHDMTTTGRGAVGADSSSSSGMDLSVYFDAWNEVAKVHNVDAHARARALAIRENRDVKPETMRIVRPGSRLGYRLRRLVEAHALEEPDVEEWRRRFRNIAHSPWLLSRGWTDLASVLKTRKDSDGEPTTLFCGLGDGERGGYAKHGQSDGRSSTPTPSSGSVAPSGDTLQLVAELDEIRSEARYSPMREVLLERAFEILKALPLELRPELADSVAWSFKLEQADLASELERRGIPWV